MRDLRSVISELYKDMDNPVRSITEAVDKGIFENMNRLVAEQVLVASTRRGDLLRLASREWEFPENKELFEKRLSDES